MRSRKNQLPQQFISRILKPFFNVADIVKTNRGWYSYEPPLKNIAEQASAQIIEMDEDLIGFLVGDFDKSGNKKVVDGRYLFFDFERAYLFWEAHLLRYFADWVKPKNQEIKQYAAAKLERMLAYYTSREGRDQMEAALQASGQTISEMFKSRPDATFEDFYQEFVRRIGAMLEIASKLNA